MVPKGYRKNIKLVKDKVGFERRQGILDDIDNKGTFLPRGVMYEDIDQSFIDFVDKDLEIVIDGEKVPVIFLTLQRWSEFSKTWQFADKFKNVKMPFITVVRLPNPQVGKNQAGLFNIPGRRTYTYMKVPTFDGGRRGVDVYKIPQPTSVDFNYEVRLFCNKMRDLNKLNLKVQQAFQSIQFYIRVNGHPMPILLESIGDESNIDDFENRRFYVQPFEMQLLGYILDEDDFEVIPALNRALIITEVSETPVKPIFRVKASTDEGTATYSFDFRPKAEVSFSFEIQYDIKFVGLVNVSDISNIIIQVNGNEVVNGLTLSDNFTVNAGDTIFIGVTKNYLDNGKFQLLGNIL
jgi:hypothetical protein